MGNVAALLLVVMVIVIGIGACWAITANGAATGTATDTFGNAPSAEVQAHNTDSSGVAIATMPILLIAFFIMICVVLVAAFAWLWNTGKSKAGGY